MGVKGARATKAKKAVKQSVLTSWKSTLFGLISGAAVGYAGYASGNPELIVAGAGMVLQGAASKDGNVSGNAE